MTRAIITLILLQHCSQDDVIQEPKIIWEPKNGSTTLNCKHNKGISYYQMYWYRQRPGETMRLIVFTTTGSKPDFGDVDEKKFEAQKSDAESESLKVKDLEPDDSGIYFCLRISVNSGYPAYFGNGTKLTVLGEKPEVEILKPSGTETSCKQKVTLVCVAKNFYPDHVSITWTVGSKEIKDDVATDPYATQDKETKLFSITSRLKVSKKEFKPQNTFRCTVRFYNETDVSINRHGEINGIAGISLDTS
uniref:Ig-like domain-containing protein n=1 Tax=Sinocyclocheilus anshuiensis TaxID=1608454 RepID=A0A671SBV2_9TELE